MNKWLNDLHIGDARRLPFQLPEDSVDLVVTSPPYNVGIDYDEHDDDMHFDAYREFLEDAFRALDFCVKDSGRVCVNVSLKNDGGIVDIPSAVKKKAKENDWDLRFEIIWDKGSSESSTAWGSWRSPSSPRPIFNHEYIFVFDVGDESKESEKTLSKHDFMKYVKSVWDVNPETSSNHPAAFPEEIPRRLIKLNSYEEDVVLDPFIGSGTTAVAAQKLNREWVGLDVSEKYLLSAQRRIEEETNFFFDDRSLMEL